MGVTVCIARVDVHAHLERVLADRRFASAERNAGFLRYVVESTLDGRAGKIKETVIGTEVYGRSTGYDPKSDSMVRVEASRLRQKLRSYYENEGELTAIRFHLPSGSYVPLFERRDVAPILEGTSSAVVPKPLIAPTATVVLVRSNFFQNRRIVVGAGASLLALLFSLQVARGSRSAGSQDPEP
jgi:hypothetical protein